MPDSSWSDEVKIIAIDIGGSSTKLALVSQKGKIENWRSFPTVADSGADFLEKMLPVCCELRVEASVTVVGASVAVAGFVRADGSLEYNPNLPWLEDAPIGAQLARELGLRVHVDADSNAAALAEYMFGEGRGASRFLCLTGGTGLGVGMVIDGKLLRIAHGCMGDAGHVIVSPEGPVCTCGGRGCAEALLSTASLGKRYAEARGADDVDFRSLVEDGGDAKAANSSARVLLEEAGYWLGIAAASLANILLPDRIAIAGGLSQAGDLFFQAAQASFRGHGGKLPLSLASLVRASTGEHATLIGAAAGFFNPELL